MNTRSFNKLLLIIISGIVLCSIVGWMYGKPSSSPSRPYKLTVWFDTPTKIIQKIEVDALPGIPFAVRTVDEASNHYVVSGTLRQETDDRFELDSRKIEMSNGWNRFAIPTNGPFELVIGTGFGGGTVDGAVLDGYGIELTREWTK